MKIICDNCRTKYSIADEKVKGKVFKIRCKKCSNIIVVRGNQPQAEGLASAGEAAYEGGGGEDFGEAPTWHLVVDQKQIGPMTAAEVRDRYARGEIDADTYIWREGFSDWMRVSQVDDFSDIAQSTMVAAGGSAAAEAAAAAAAGYAPQEQAWNAGADDGQQWSEGAGAPGAAAASWDAPQAAAASWSADAAGSGHSESEGMFGAAAPAADSGRDPGRDLFGTGEAADQGYGTPAATNEGGLFASPGAMSTDAGAQAGAQAGGDLFGGATGGNGGQQLFPQGDEPEPANAQMTGARNENSVLFSLSNLQALAMGPGGGGGGGGGGGVGVMAPAPAPSGSDGSGLIDIRSMAGAGPAPAAPSTDDGLPDLGGFAAPIAAAPVLIPAASDDRPGWLLPTIIGGSVVLVGAVVALVLVLTLRRPPEPVYVAAATPTPAQPASPAQPPPANTSTTTPEKPAGTANTTTGETKPEEPKAKATAKGRRHHRTRPGKSGGARKPSHVASRNPSNDLLGGGSTKSKPGRKHDALDDLIDGAVGSRKKGKSKRAAAAAPAADSNLPETLSRAQIQGGMRAIKAKVQGCYDRYKVPGMANVQVKISRGGRVSTARVVGMFAGTPTGACVQAAAKSAKFDQFKGAAITITYPFILR